MRSASAVLSVFVMEKLLAAVGQGKGRVCHDAGREDFPVNSRDRVQRHATRCSFDYKFSGETIRIVSRFFDRKDAALKMTAWAAAILQIDCQTLSSMRVDA